MTQPVKLVLSNGEEDEFEVGILTQGACFERFRRVGSGPAVKVYDVASGQQVAQTSSTGGWISQNSLRDYASLYVQPVNE